MPQCSKSFAWLFYHATSLSFLLSFGPLYHLDERIQGRSQKKITTEAWGEGGGGEGSYLNATLGALCSCMRLFNAFVGGLFLYEGLRQQRPKQGSADQRFREK